MFPLLYGSSGGGSGNLYCKLSGDWNMVSESCWKRLILKYTPWGISDPEGPETSGWCWRPRPGPGQCTAGGSCDGEPARRPWAEWRSSPYFCTHPVIFKGEVLDQCEEAGNIFSRMTTHRGRGVILKFLPFMIIFKLILTPLCLIHLFLQLINLLQFSLPTVLSRHLIFPPSPDVAADVELLLCHIFFAQHIVELVHGRVHDIFLLQEDACQHKTIYLEIKSPLC